MRCYSGTRRIRFFYWVVVYFDYVKAPAIIMFPLWLANELVQLTWGGVSSVAYVAHIGGLLAGGALAAGVRARPGRVDADFLDVSQRAETRTIELDNVRRLLGSLEVDRARATLNLLSKDYPHDREIQLQVYRVEKFDPETQRFHRAALQLLTSRNDDRAAVRGEHELFLDYLATTNGRIRLPCELLVELAIRFAKGGFLKTSTWIVKRLLALQSNTRGLEQALVALAKTYRQRSDHAMYRRYLKLLIEHFPAGDAAKAARATLDEHAA